MKSTVTIGRSSRCDIIIPDEKISREHARISIVGGQYVYEDIGKNGSVIGGQIIKGQRMAIAPGAEILLAGKVPLPWAQVYSMLPLQGGRPFESETSLHSYDAPHEQYVPVRNDGIGIGWGIVSFLIPIVGWILYFVWEDDYPRKASQASGIAWAGFIINLILVIAAA